jgi:hypothetical protein
MANDIDSFADIPDPFRPSRARPTPPPPPVDEPSPTRNESSRRRAVAIAVGAAWVVALTLGLGLRPDLVRVEILAQLAVWTFALPVGLAIALRPGTHGFPPGATALRLGLAGVAASFVGLALLPVTGQEMPISPRSVGVCLSIALTLALPSLVAAVIVLRHAFVNAPVLRGALVGAACGLAGSVGIHSHCPVVTVSHVLLAHGLPVALFAAAGAIFGARAGRV